MPMREAIADKSAPTSPGDGSFWARIERARSLANAALLRERNGHGWWTGELSASALSTATAVTALTLYVRNQPAEAERLGGLIRGGYAWLIQHQNADGGWGDTTRSFSNLSTTTLVWAALGLQRELDPATTKAVASAARWIEQRAGSLEPRELVRAIEGRYGKDRTFSIPILTMCALCGRLGPDGWAHVRQLPFEIAALPQRWFGALQLPVVSYALPALIAIGHVRHGRRPTRNPLLRLVRERCRARTLEKLVRLQPENGGFLEAAPLTSFVTMSLAALGLTQHVVVERGVEFLAASVRADGSWPIDTNLATWVTTLSVNALTPVAASVSERKDDPSLTLAATDRVAIRDWLLRQQHRVEHRYTLAAPGGWAWTDLPGGVPDADDTPGAMLALHRLAPDDPGVRAAAEAGAVWLLDLQNRDGGMPTFCRGWGRLPFDRSSPDLTAHAIRAWLAWRAQVSAPVQSRIEVALARAEKFLERTQRADGAWVPLWFGHQEARDDENPVYGTARVVPALCELSNPPPCLLRAVRWLIAVQNPDGGWAGAPGAASSLEETGLTLEALAAASEVLRVRSPAFGRNPNASNLPPEGGTTSADALTDVNPALERGAAWLADAVEREQWREPAPIGFYFAKLWYFERLYPLIFATAALNRLAALR